jgi:hypothetical protein
MTPSDHVQCDVNTTRQCTLRSLFVITLVVALSLGLCKYVLGVLGASTWAICAGTLVAMLLLWMWAFTVRRASMILGCFVVTVSIIDWIAVFTFAQGEENSRLAIFLILCILAMCALGVVGAGMAVTELLRRRRPRLLVIIALLLNLMPLGFLLFGLIQERLR